MKEKGVGNLTDEQLIEIYLKEQHSRYFDELYRRYSPKVFGKCISLLKEQALAEDATQEVFMKILLNLSKFRGRSRFSTWLYSITYNYCIDYIRRNKKYSSVFSEERIEDHEQEEEIDDKEILEVRIGRLKVILDAIPVKDKSILLMKYQDGMSIAEIAEGFQKTESAIKMQLKRAKQKFIKKHNELYKESR